MIMGILTGYEPVDGLKEKDFLTKFQPLSHVNLEDDDNGIVAQQLKKNREGSNRIYRR